MKLVLILMTKDGFRVAPVPCYEDLFDGYADDMNRYVNVENFTKVFQNSELMTETDAREVARMMAKAYKELPEGIRTLTTYRKYTFEDLLNGKASKN
jgi:hypothetical protein